MSSSSPEIKGRWQLLRLGDLLAVEHGFAFKGEHFDPDGPDVLLTPKNFLPSGGLDVAPARCKRYSGPRPDRFVLNKGDVVVAMTDLKQEAPILGAAGTVPESNLYLHNQRIGKVAIRDRRCLLSSFAPLLLNSHPIRGRVRATATGATVRHTAPVRIEAIEVRIPDVSTQARIARVVAAFDELIEINERRIELLEDLARSLYREWFVHFRFPGHEEVEFVDSELGVIPEGWTVGRLGDLADVVVHGVEAGQLDPVDPYIGLEHLPRRHTTLREWGSSDSVTSRKLAFQRGDTIFGKIRPYFHKVVWAPFSGAASSDTIVFRAKPTSEVAGFVNAVASSDQFVAVAVATSNGTKMPRANSKALLNYPLPLPQSGLLEMFEAAVTRWLDLSGSLSRQNRHLAATRDLLLPRLVTGRLDISDVDLGVLTPAEPE